MTAPIVLLMIGLSATGAGMLALGDAQDPKPATANVPPIDPPQAEAKPDVTPPPIADRLAKILAEYQAQQEAMRQAQEKVDTRREWFEIYSRMAPDDVAFCRRMIDLALSSPKDPAARDALIWALDKPGRGDSQDYGDEYARAAALLVRHHGDDPEAVRVGLQMNNLVSAHRDLLLTGFLASARGRESKGLARLALARYLQHKAGFAEATRKGNGDRGKLVYAGVIGDDGKRYDKEVEESDEAYAYRLLLRLSDPDAIKAEAERLANEIIADYGDVPYVTTRLRELEALLKGPSPRWNGKPMTEDEIEKLKKTVQAPRTLGQVAEGLLDEMHNLVVGKPAPEIDGTDLQGNPLKLASYRGKVVVLVFWGSWCGPCMREIPHHRELVERLKGKPFVLLGINCNESRAAALKAVAAERITWPNWLDGGGGNGPIVSRYHIRGYPTVIVLDGEGKIRANRISGDAQLDKLVDQLLGEVEAKPKNPGE